MTGSDISRPWEIRKEDTERGEKGRWSASLCKLRVYVLRTQAKDGKTIVEGTQIYPQM